MLCVYYYLYFGVLFVQVLPFPLVPCFLDGCTFPEKLGGGGGSQECCNDWVCYLLLCSLPYPSPEDVNGSCFSIFFLHMFLCFGLHLHCPDKKSTFTPLSYLFLFAILNFFWGGHQNFYWGGPEACLRPHVSYKFYLLLEHVLPFLLVSAELFLSLILTPLFRLLLHRNFSPFLNLLSQRCQRCP